MRHFLDLADCSRDDLQHLLDSAVALKAEWRAGGNRPVLDGQVLGMIFQKPSLRTRVSFEVAMLHLGGHAIMLTSNEIGLGKRESIADVARTLGGYVQGIMARVFAHEDLLELARWSPVPVINGLTDAQHPCQALADLLTIYERFGRLDGVRIAYIGDGNNVAASLAQAAAHFGAHIAIATPPGFAIPEAMMDSIGALAEQNGGDLESYHDPRTAVANADVVYTDTWVSMGQEADAERRLPHFAGYQVDSHLLSGARPQAIVMHCLPAHRGQEISDEVADGAQSAIFQQAANRLHAQKAIVRELMGRL